MAMAQRSELR